MDTKNNRIDIHVIIFIHITLYINRIIILERADVNINISIQLGYQTHASSAPVDDRERRVFKSLSTDLYTLMLTVVPLYPVTLPASTKP